MKKYLVKETSHATDRNPNFKGEMCVAYYGKNQEMVAREGTHCAELNFDRMDYMVESYGYDRLCDAKRSWIFKHPETNENWQSTTEIIEVEC